MSVVKKVGKPLAKTALVTGALLTGSLTLGIGVQVAITACEIGTDIAEGNTTELVVDAIGGVVSIATMGFSAVATYTAKTVAKKSVVEAAKATVKQAGKEAGKKATKEIGQQAAKEIATNGLKGVTKEATVRAAQQATQETSKRVIQQTTQKVGKEVGQKLAKELAQGLTSKAAQHIFNEGLKMESKEVAKELLEDAFAGPFKAALKNSMVNYAALRTSTKNLSQFTFKEAATAGAKKGFEQFASVQAILFYVDLIKVIAKKVVDKLSMMIV